MRKTLQIIVNWKGGLTRDDILQYANAHLLKAQDHIKNNADKKRRGLTFKMGSLVYLKLKPFRQRMYKAFYQTLASKLCGSFKVLEKVVKVAYRLEFPRFLNTHGISRFPIKIGIGQGT